MCAFGEQRRDDGIVIYGITIQAAGGAMRKELRSATEQALRGCRKPWPECQVFLQFLSRVQYLRCPGVFIDMYLPQQALASMTERDSELTAILVRERTRLGHIIRRRVPDPEEAEDLLQDVFEELVQAYRLPNRLRRRVPGYFASLAIASSIAFARSTVDPKTKSIPVPITLLKNIISTCSYPAPIKDRKRCMQDRSY